MDSDAVLGALGGQILKIRINMLNKILGSYAV